MIVYLLIQKLLKSDPTLPDYNLDGDRSYAWPCWDVTDPQSTIVNDKHPPTTTTPLRPEATVNDSTAHEALASVIIVSN
jgi:hypothetical protein